MTEPPVTIVTPSLNQGRFLRATIESVLGQDYPRLEYLIMDGGSTDDTADVARDYAGRLTFVSEPDRGQSHAINKGFRRASGEIVAWLNSDDLLLPGAVFKAVKALDAHPEAAAVYGEGYRIDEEGSVLGRFPFTEAFNLWKLVYLRDYILQQTVFFRKEAVIDAGYLDESLHYTMDWDLLIRLGKRRPLCYTAEMLACIREHAAAKSFSGGRARIREIAGLLRRHTGRRYPPGLLAYGLERHRHGLLAPIAGRAVDRIVRHAQGLYRDGWAGPRMRYMLPAGSGQVELSGTAPEPLALEVLSDGRPAGAFEVGSGDFQVRFAAEGAAELEIRASPWWRAASDQAEGPRRLCYVLRRIQRVSP